MNVLKAFRSFILLAIGMIALHWLTEGTFLSSRNLTLLSRQVAINGILAVGMTYVILIGGIDLSVGSLVALTGVVVGLLQFNQGLAHWEGGMAWMGAGLCVLAAVLVGLACGAVNGLLITRFRIAPFIITLGMMVIARGLALIFSNGTAISPLGEAFNFIGQSFIQPMAAAILIGGVGAVFIGLILLRSKKTSMDYARACFGVLLTGLLIYAFQGDKGLPVPTLIFAVLGILGALVLRFTRLGRFVLAIGGNAEAAWLAGVPIRKITFGIYAAMGALAGLAGAVQSARLNSAYPTAGELFELDAIAAVVIGGTSLLGGVGTVTGSIFGAFFIGILNNGMSLMGVGEFYQKVAKGVIIILAVWLDSRQSGKKEVVQPASTSAGAGQGSGATAPVPGLTGTSAGAGAASSALRAETAVGGAGTPSS